jgi:hypothetical protein
MKLQYLQPISSASGWGAGLAALGKGVKDTAQWSLERIDKDKEHARADEELKIKQNDSAAKNAYYGASTKEMNQQISQSAALHPQNLKRAKALADIEEFNKFEKGLTIEQLNFIDKNYPLDSAEAQKIVKEARETNPLMFKNMSDRGILLMSIKEPENYKNMLMVGMTPLHVGNGVNGDRITANIVQPATGKTRQYDLGEAPTSSSKGNYDIKNFEDDHGTKRSILLDKDTGDYKYISESAKPQTTQFDSELSAIFNKMLYGVNPDTWGPNFINAISGTHNNDNNQEFPGAYPDSQRKGEYHILNDAVESVLAGQGKKINPEAVEVIKTLNGKYVRLKKGANIADLFIDADIVDDSKSYKNKYRQGQ